MLSATAACLKVPQGSASLSALEATEVTAGELQMRVYGFGTLWAMRSWRAATPRG